MGTVQEIIEKYLKDKLEYEEKRNKSIKEIMEKYLEDKKEFEEIKNRRKISFL